MVEGGGTLARTVLDGMPLLQRLMALGQWVGGAAGSAPSGPGAGPPFPIVVSAGGLRFQPELEHALWCHAEVCGPLGFSLTGAVCMCLEDLALVPCPLAGGWTTRLCGAAPVALADHASLSMAVMAVVAYTVVYVWDDGMAEETTRLEVALKAVADRLEVLDKGIGTGIATALRRCIPGTPEADGGGDPAVAVAFNIAAGEKPCCRFNVGPVVVPTLRHLVVGYKDLATAQRSGGAVLPTWEGATVAEMAMRARIKGQLSRDRVARREEGGSGQTDTDTVAEVGRVDAVAKAPVARGPVTREAPLTAILMRVSSRAQAKHGASLVMQFVACARILSASRVASFEVAAEVASVSATPARSCIRSRTVTWGTLSELEARAERASATAELVVAAPTRLTRSWPELRLVAQTFRRVCLVFLDLGVEVGGRRMGSDGSDGPLLWYGADPPPWLPESRRLSDDEIRDAMRASVVSQRGQSFYVGTHLVMDRMLASLQSGWVQPRADKLWDAARAALCDAILRRGVPVRVILVVRTSVTSALKTSETRQQAFLAAPCRPLSGNAADASSVDVSVCMLDDVSASCELGVVPALEERAGQATKEGFRPVFVAVSLDRPVRSKRQYEALCALGADVFTLMAMGLSVPRKESAFRGEDVGTDPRICRPDVIGGPRERWTSESAADAFRLGRTAILRGPVMSRAGPAILFFRVVAGPSFAGAVWEHRQDVLEEVNAHEIFLHVRVRDAGCYSRGHAGDGRLAVGGEELHEQQQQQQQEGEGWDVEEEEVEEEEEEEEVDEVVEVEEEGHNDSNGGGSVPASPCASPPSAAPGTLAHLREAVVLAAVEYFGDGMGEGD